MFDVGKLSFEIECPCCSFSTEVSLQEVTNRDSVICRGCKKYIRLEDATGTGKRAAREVQSSLDELARTLKGL